MLSSLALGRDGVWLRTPPPPAAGRDGVSVSSAAGALARREPRKGNIRRGGGRGRHTPWRESLSNLRSRPS